uniref:Uncharacterized protein n=1 Tax=Anguilla anguilla TaxID=7936 RepID=A0A0E9TT35_ANGAN
MITYTAHRHLSTCEFSTLRICEYTASML